MALRRCPTFTATFSWVAASFFFDRRLRAKRGYQSQQNRVRMGLGFELETCPSLEPRFRPRPFIGGLRPSDIGFCGTASSS
jgi:hypothetical protein